MAGTRQILSTLDLRTQEERQELSKSQALAKSIQGIIQTVSQGEKVRRERQQLDRVATAIAGGATTIEAIAAAANEPTEFSPGIKGGLQKIAGRFGPQGGGIGDVIKQSIISDALKKALQPKPLLTRPEKRELELFGKRKRPGDKPLLTREEQRDLKIFGQRDRPGKGGVKPFEPTKAGKAVDRDIKVLESDAPDSRKSAARDRLRKNPELREITPGQLDDQFEAEIEGKALEGGEKASKKPKVKVKGATFDKAFGKAAYDQTLQELKDAALAQGVTEASVEADFNRWWDEQAALDDPKGFGKRMIPRSEFQQGVEEVTPTGGKLDEPTAQAILAEAGFDKTKARALAKQRGFTF